MNGSPRPSLPGLCHGRTNRPNCPQGCNKSSDHWASVQTPLSSVPDSTSRRDSADVGQPPSCPMGSHCTPLGFYIPSFPVSPAPGIPNRSRPYSMALGGASSICPLGEPARGLPGRHGDIRPMVFFPSHVLPVAHSPACYSTLSN